MSDATAARPRPTALQLALLAVIVVAGVWIRVRGITTQILGDDEWHSLHTLMTRSYGWIATHFGVVDHCIPLTLFEKACADTIGISELEPRLLPLAFGVLALALLPWLVADRLGWRVALLFAGLLAISPQLVHYARFGRPYSVSFTCAAVALFAFERWWRAGGTRWAVLFVAASALGAWFHLTVVAFVAPAFAWALFRRRDSAHVRPFRALVLAGVAFALATFVFIGPPLVIDFAAFANRSVGQSGELAESEKVLELWRGTVTGPFTFVFGVGLVWGLVALWKEARDLGVLFALAAAGSFALIVVTRPAVSYEALVVARYALPVLALVLVVASAGLLRIEAHVRREFAWWPAGLASAAFVVLAAVNGPLRSIHATPNDWTNHGAFQASYAERFVHGYARNALGLTSMPSIYELISRDAPPDGIVVEAPWNYESSLNPYPIFQRVHHRALLAGFVTPAGAPLPLGEVAEDDARFRLRNYVWVRDVATLRARGVSYVVFHRTPVFGLTADDARHPRLADVETLIEQYKRDVGPPVHEDAEVCLFALAPAK